ncbi:MAG: hypothetical protein RRC34_08075 [Lentisphaeria bacterium]|nr:hypothetical protein [Lentisphaeria bacterium]
MKSDRDNVFVDGPTPVSGGGNNTARVRKFMKGELGQERLLKHVNITQPPYSERYPRLLAIYTGESPVTTQSVRSLVTTASDPRFIDGENGDFPFKDVAEIQKQLPGFKPIPFDKIGLLNDEYRERK